MRDIVKELGEVDKRECGRISAIQNRTNEFILQWRQFYRRMPANHQIRVELERRLAELAEQAGRFLRQFPYYITLLDEIESDDQLMPVSDERIMSKKHNEIIGHSKCQRG